ncbi:hypothetical protein PHAVU_010G103300 [Phaseolus vulgaris]|uniref:Uncharacterized protein n=1 Tax=Phaseolus vulgaris TaxID=3885 RepID=V7AP81_PHAVU|nr:hypothetical protein PHAVU_010G103300g [Phaseolus vulgaris]ESW07120.1 hypothetical protein PHAVU_010G103300g [Phaseolus vulgaris]
MDKKLIFDERYPAPSTLATSTYGQNFHQPVRGRFYCSQLYLLNLVPNSSALIGQCRPKSVMHPQLYYQE